MHIYRTLFLPIVAVAMTACALGPDYKRPDLGIPEKFSQEVPSGESIANLGWWRVFEDPVLQQLIRNALEENKDIKTAAARVEESRAILGFTRADQFPQINLSGDATRVDPSDEALDFSPKPRNSFGLLANLSFELDIWGRLRRATEAERAALLSTEYAQRSVTLTVIAQAVTLYVNILGQDERLTIAQETLKNRQGATGVIRSRFEKGVVPELDVNQAEIEERDAEIAITVIERNRKQAENALSVLLGRMPFSIPRGRPIAAHPFPDNLPAGAPAELLERRPDVMAAEETVRSETARIGVAQAERLPRLDLLGFVGLRSQDSDDLFHGNAHTWQIGGSLLGPLIDWGKSLSNKEAKEARALQALHQYELTVLKAVQEVDDSLVGVNTYRREYEQRMSQTKSARNAARLSRARYDDGVTSYLEVLDIERSLFESELGASQARESYLNSIVQLYKALGGGWQVQEAQP